MEVVGCIRVTVGDGGEGRVVAESPKPEEDLREGTMCKWTLKERG